MCNSAHLLRGPLVLLGLATVLLACGAPRSGSEGQGEPPRPAPEFERPPIIVVDIDTLRADHLGCYGYGRDTSPNLDTFAAGAARFEWAFAQGPNTPPSQSSILTGLYPTSHGRVLDRQTIAPEVETLAESLATAGYATAAYVDGGLMARGFGLEQGFEIYDDGAGGIEKIGPLAEGYIDQHLAGDQPERPFFLLVHTYDVHSPYELTPLPFRDHFLSELETLPAEDYRSNMSRDMRQTWDARHDDPPPQLDPAQLAYAKAMYDGGIRHVDHWFGGFLDFLRQRGLLERAIVVVISDHGDEFQEHDTLFHERIYSTVTRIPLILRFPDGWGQGVWDEVVESIDLAPTLLDYVEAEGAPGIQGSSLLPMLRGERQKGQGTAISESPFLGRRITLTTREDRYFLTVKGGESELYAYRDDPLEQHDLAAEQPERLQQLRRAVARWQRAVQTQRYRGEEAIELDETTLEQLRTLGYLN